METSSLQMCPSSGGPFNWKETLIYPNSTLLSFTTSISTYADNLSASLGSEFLIFVSTSFQQISLQGYQNQIRAIFH
jgi:hypothetical protein